MEFKWAIKETRLQMKTTRLAYIPAIDVLGYWIFVLGYFRWIFLNETAKEHSWSWSRFLYELKSVSKSNLEGYNIQA